MSKSECNNSNNWDSFDAALAMFDPDLKIIRAQGTQETREPLNAFAELDATIATDEPVIALTDVKKPL